MGLQKWNTELRSLAYPPRTISEALEFSASHKVCEWYQKSEQVFQSEGIRSFKIPPWAMTWPGGQLSGIGRNGRFAENIQRYERVFSDAFPEQVVKARSIVPDSSRLHFVNVVPLEFLQKDGTLRMTLESLAQQADERSPRGSPRLRDGLKEFHADRAVRRNPSTNLLQPSMEPSEAEKLMLAKRLLGTTQELESLCKRSFGWL